MIHLQDIHARQQSELRHSQFFCSDASPSTCGSTGGSGSNVWLCWAGSCAECLPKGLREKKGRTILLLFQKGKLRARGRLHEHVSPLKISSSNRETVCHSITTYFWRYVNCVCLVMVQRGANPAPAATNSTTSNISVGALRPTPSNRERTCTWAAALPCL